MLLRSITTFFLVLLISFSSNSYSAQGYELFYNGKLKAHKPNMTLYQSIGNLHANIKKYPSIDVKGYYNSERIPASAKGYGLYRDGRRDGYKSNWPLHEAVKNLHWNQKKVPQYGHQRMV